MALALALVLAGCGSSGGGDDRPTPAATGEPTPVVEPTPSPDPSPTETPRPRLYVLATTDPGSFNSVRFLLSDDLGETWRALEPFGTFEPTTGFAFADRNHGVVLGRTSALRTTDGGRSWTTQLDVGEASPNEGLAPAAVTIDPTGTAVVFGNRGLADDRRTYRYATWLLPGDGAAAERRDADVEGSAPIFAFCLSADGTGVATGVRFELMMALIPFQTVLVTGDGGVSWTSAPPDIAGPATLWAATACAGPRLWLAGARLDRRPQIARSDDGGVTWSDPTLFPEIEYGTLRDVTFMDARSGWLVGNGEYPQRPFAASTSDGGATWTVRDFATSTVDDVYAVAFLDERLGVVGGEKGGGIAVLLITEDGGATWRSVDLPAGVRAVAAAAIVR